MEHQNETVNIFLKSQADKDKVLSNASSNAKYIILQNDVLQAENRAKTVQIVELNAKNDELESDNDRMSEGRRYTQGLLKNLVELEKMHFEISKKNAMMVDATNKQIFAYQKKAEQHLKYLQCVLVVLLGFIWELSIMDRLQFSLMTVLIVFCVTFSVNMNRALVLPTFPLETDRIKELEVQIKEIKDSQDFITDHIESL